MVIEAIEPSELEDGIIYKAVSKCGAYTHIFIYKERVNEHYVSSESKIFYGDHIALFDNKIQYQKTQLPTHIELEEFIIYDACFSEKQMLKDSIKAGILIQMQPINEIILW